MTTRVGVTVCPVFIEILSYLTIYIYTCVYGSNVYEQQNALGNNILDIYKRV